MRETANCLRQIKPLLAARTRTVSRTAAVATALALSHAGMPAGAVEIGSLTLDGTLASFSDFATGTQLDNDPVLLTRGLSATGLLPQFSLAGYLLTDVFVAFTLSGNATASITSRAYLAHTQGHPIDVVGNLSVVLDDVAIAGKQFAFPVAPDLDGCSQDAIAESTTIPCGAVEVSDDGSLSFTIAADDLAAFIGAGTVDVVGRAGTGFSFSVEGFPFYPIDGQLDGTVAFDFLRVRYGYICERNPDDLDACADDGGGGNGTVPEPGSLALLAAGALAMLARYRRPQRGVR